jgi:hypothetical protein
MKRPAVLLLLCAIPLCCQPNKGELHLRLVDPAGRTIQGAIQIVSQANQYNAAPKTNKSDRIDMQLQVNGEKLNNVLNVVDFGGLFPGSAFLRDQSKIQLVHVVAPDP